MIRFEKLLWRCDSYRGEGLAVRELHSSAKSSENVGNRSAV